MITLNAEIEQFDSHGEKTGWSYIFIPQAIAEQIKPDERRWMRVKGKIDEVSINGMALVPMGEGDYILALNKPLRKLLRKETGAKVTAQLEFDADFKIEIPADLEICLADEELLTHFSAMTKSHQNYFINWLNTAKTEPTRTKRLVMIINAMAQKHDFSAMMRSAKQSKA